MAARRCKQGHYIAGKNVIWCLGGYKGRKYARCKKCVNKQISERRKLRYETDPEYREKIKVKGLARKQRNRLILSAQRDSTRFIHCMGIDPSLFGGL